MQDIKPIRDPDLYRKLCEPHASEEAFDVEGFNRAVRALREKYRIPDVVLILSANVMIDGAEQAVVTYGHHGDALRTELLLAWALGQEREKKAKLLRAIANEVT